MGPGHRLSGCAVLSIGGAPRRNECLRDCGWAPPHRLPYRLPCRGSCDLDIGVSPRARRQLQPAYPPELRGSVSLLNYYENLWGKWERIRLAGLTT